METDRLMETDKLIINGHEVKPFDEGLATIEVSYDYTIKSDTDKETTIIETETHKIGVMLKKYMREITIQKDNAFISKWFNSLSDENLIRIRTILNVIMDERGIKGK